MIAQRHSIVFCFLSALVILLFHYFTMSTLTQLVVLTGAVILAGLPHGALDPLLFIQTNGEINRKKSIRFYLSYVLGATVTFLFWLWQPEISLILFLVISAWHFADDWCAVLPRSYQLGVGASVIILPIFFQPVEVITLFGYLGVNWSQTAVANVIFIPGVLACAVMILAVLTSLYRKSWASLEVFSLGALAVLTPPLIFFSVYFCLLHSPRHILNVIEVLKPNIRSLLIYGITFTLLSLVIIFAAVESRTAIQGSAVLTQAIFIGLFCLTVPHMFVVNRFRDNLVNRRSSKHC